MGFTFVSFWNEWQEGHRVKPSSFLEINNDELVFKMQITLPYQAQFSNELTNAHTAIYEGEFYESYEQNYKNDTLYTHYRLLRVSRDNILSLMKEVHENLNAFSKNHKTPSQRALEFFKNFSKDYVELHTKMIAWFWVEDLGFKNYNYSQLYSNPSLSVISPPPISCFHKFSY